MTRAEHLDWCKQRALAELKTGSVANAWASMVSDMLKHPDTEGHSALALGTMLLASGQNRSPEEMKKFINGFN